MKLTTKSTYLVQFCPKIVPGLLVLVTVLEVTIVEKSMSQKFPCSKVASTVNSLSSLRSNLEQLELCVNNTLFLYSSAWQST